jgi:MYXO-CTERM domain-containing protein
MGETFFAFNPEGPPFTGPMGFDPTGTAYDAFLLRVPGPTALDGAVCAIDLECKSLHCVDGVCCDTACNAACQACSAAKKATGADGACGPAKVDTDPGDRCPTGTSACGADGLCDATGKCRPFAKVGTSCGVSSCTASLQTDKVCKGDGDTCIDATVPCGRYVCGATTCKTTCAIDDDCATDSHCVSGACAAKEPNGVACTADRACVSGHCVDGVCCDSGCEGQCQACDGPTKGTCVPIAGSPHGTRAACDGVGACQGSCDGTDAKVCKLPVGKVCASSCVDGAETLDRCTDLGACKPGTKVSCGAYTCGAAGCRDACTTTADCAAGAVCAAGKCVGPNPDGAACSSGVQCASGHCVDGVCCNTKCDGQCEACDGATKGTCAAVTGTPRGKRPACEGVGVCGATCTGVERTVCLHPSGTLCASTCVDGSEAVSRCDGKGVCREGAPKTCSDGCADARCRAACEKDVDCGVDAACIDGVCRSLAPIPGGGCGCSTVGGDQSGAWAVTLLTIVATRRRRRR